MARGFLAGSFWGAVLGAGLLTVSSQVVDRQELSFPRPETGSVDVPGGSEFDQARSESDPVVPQTDEAPENEGAVEIETPEAEVEEPPKLETAALDAPEPTVGDVEELGDAPEPSTDEQPIVSSEATDDAVAAALQNTLEVPDTPGVAPSAEVEEPEAPAAQASAGENTESGVAANDGSEDAKPEETEIAALPSTETDDANAVATPEAQTDDAPSVTSQTEAPLAPATPDQSGGAQDVTLPNVGGTDDGPEAPKLPQIAVEPSLPDAGDQTPVLTETAAPAPAPAPATEGSDGAETVTVDGGASVLTPVEELTDQAEGVETNRLPQAGEGAEEAEETAEAGEAAGDEGADDASSEQATVVDGLPRVRRIGEEAAATDAEPEAEAEADASAGEGTETANAAPVSGPALVAYGSPYVRPENTSLMSVILVHSTPGLVSDAVLSAVPEHVGFAVDGGLSNAAEVAAAYRAAGREVILIPSLPQGATPQDVEQALRSNFEAVPEAIAVMDITGGSFQTDRAAVGQVVDVVSDTGHGMITFPRGLNAAHQQAERAGVPTGLIFRNLDGGSETAGQIQRTLDRAAFRARQDAAVILVGSTEASTLSALTEWALGVSASNVEIAPVSAALVGQ